MIIKVPASYLRGGINCKYSFVWVNNCGWEDSATAPTTHKVTEEPLATRGTLGGTK